MDVDLWLTKFFVDNLLVLQVVFFLETLVVVSHWHQMPLDDSCHFQVVATCSTCHSTYLVWWIRWISSLSAGRYEDHSRWHSLPMTINLICDYSLPTIAGINHRLIVHEWTFVDTDWWLTATVLGLFPTGTRDNPDWRACTPWGVTGHTVHLEVSEEKDVFVVLLQHYFK